MAGKAAEVASQGNGVTKFKDGTLVVETDAGTFTDTPKGPFKVLTEALQDESVSLKGRQGLDEMVTGLALDGDDQTHADMIKTIANLRQDGDNKSADELQARLDKSLTESAKLMASLSD